MITCSQAARQLWEYLDATLSEAARTAVEEHLALCLRCCGELEFAEELRKFLAGNARDQVPADVLHRLNDTLEELGS